MEKDWQHLGALISRVFIVTPSENLSFWNGHSDDLDCDYERISELISTEDGDITMFRKMDKQFCIFFSMATKIELYKRENSLLIVDGLFFNGSLNNFKNIVVDTNEKLSFNLLLKDIWLTVFDATLSGKEIVNRQAEGFFKVGKDEYCSYASIHLDESAYTLYRVRVRGKLDTEEIELYGVELRKED